MDLTLGSLFSGVGGFEIGAENAGIKTLWQCEIDKKCQSVLKKHYPDAILYTDVKEIKGDKIKPVDIITFGSPCQDLSIAGKRAGFEGERSGLFFEAMRIIKEMREKTNGKYPQYAIWENVQGALSSNKGADFRAALQALAELGALDVSWRILNTASFGPPQRRMRLYTIADFRGERAGRILFKQESSSWNTNAFTKKRREKTTTNSTGSINGSSKPEINTFTKGKRAQSKTDYETWDTDRPAPTLNLFDNGGESRATVLITYKDINNTVLTMQGKPDHEIENFIVVRMRGGKAGGGKGALTRKEQSLTLKTSNDQILFEKNNKYKVRRLTPLECERLQGWPDNYTKYNNEGKEIAKTTRYKMIGNGVSAPVAEWIFKNIIEEETGK